MENVRLLRFQPTLKMIYEEMQEEGISCRMTGENDQNYSGARLYTDGCPLRSNMLYILPLQEGCCICTCSLQHGPQIICSDMDATFLLSFLLDLFAKLHQMEMELDDLVYRGADLNTLCEYGATMLENPICLHDDWFVMIAKSSELSSVLPPDYIMTSNKEFVPQVVLEDFKFDTDYLETYSYRTAQMWNASPEAGPCIYVNLWTGSVYCGRLLLVKKNREFRSLDYLVAEVLTQRIMIVLGRIIPDGEHEMRSMDDVVYELLTRGYSDSMEVNRLTATLGWDKHDKLLCIRIRHQRSEGTVTMEHLLHSDLFRAFPGSYILLTDHQQCVVMNVTREATSFSQLRHRLAPLCRDYCLYAGVSTPVRGIRELHLAYYQAEVSLNRAFQTQSERWIVPFSDCATDYLLNHLDSPLQRYHLVAPELIRLMEMDEEKGTEYFETLRMYLLNERDIPKTSDALIIHRTTLLYRLKKIQALIDLNLDDPEVRLHLLLSLSILERERI